MKRFTGIMVFAALVAFLTPLWAAVPKLLNFQGRLTTNGGTPVQDSAFGATFRIYDAATGGNILWSESQPISTTTGIFSVVMGSVNPIPDEIFNDSLRWLGIQISPDAEITPRQQLVSVGYAYRVSSVDGSTGGAITGDLVVSRTGTFGAYNNNSGSALISGVSNIGTGAYALVVGETNTASGFNTAVCGGRSNTASGDFSAIGGGVANTASGQFAAIGGGLGNKVTSQHATLSGGYQNTVRGEEATIGGGGGSYADGAWSTVGGGGGNSAEGNNSVIAGGGGNLAGDENTTVGGGSQNTAYGFAATIPGGYNNSTGGNYAFAAGHRAKAQHAGTFVWADSADADFASTAPNQFLIRAMGGVGIGTNAPSEKLDVRGNIKLGGSGEFFAVGTDENLRGIRGLVGANGSIEVGSGFSVSRSDNGMYQVSFSVPFSDIPTVVTTALTANGNIITVAGINDSGFNVVSYKPEMGGNQYIDTEFSFIVLGPR